jgi:hypothetical protein
MTDLIYYLPQTIITFGNNSNTVLFTPQSITTAAGRISTQWNRGTGAQPREFRWRAKTKSSSAYTVGAVLEIYLATSDGTTVDGNFGTSDAGFSSADLRRNLQPVGTIVADNTTAGNPLQASGRIDIEEQFVSVVWWNALGVTLTGTAADHLFELTPVPSQLQ